MSERRKPETFESCETPFDKNKFNFNKVRPGEILFKFEKIECGNPNLVCQQIKFKTFFKALF